MNARIVTPVTILLLIFAACGAGAGDDAPDASPSPIASVTPDVSALSAIDAGREELRTRTSGSAAVLYAVETRDVDFFLAQLNVLPGVCGGDAICPGVPEGETRPLFGRLSIEAVRPAIEVLMSGELTLTYLSSGGVTYPWEYLVGFEARESLGNRVLPGTGGEAEMSGVLISLDARLAQPIVGLDLGVSPASRVLDRVGQGFEARRVFTAVLVASLPE